MCSYSLLCTTRPALPRRVATGAPHTSHAFGQRHPTSARQPDSSANRRRQGAVDSSILAGESREARNVGRHEDNGSSPSLSFAHDATGGDGDSDAYQNDEKGNGDDDNDGGGSDGGDPSTGQKVGVRGGHRRHHHYHHHHRDDMARAQERGGEFVSGEGGEFVSGEGDEAEQSDHPSPMFPFFSPPRRAMGDGGGGAGGGTSPSDIGGATSAANAGGEESSGGDRLSPSTGLLPSTLQLGLLNSVSPSMLLGPGAAAWLGGATGGVGGGTGGFGMMSAAAPSLIQTSQLAPFLLSQMGPIGSYGEFIRARKPRAQKKGEDDLGFDRVFLRC